MEKLTKMSQLVVQVHFWTQKICKLKGTFSILPLSFKRYVPFLRVVAK